ncbi:MAG TPA: cytidine deaminase [Gammaproteobacteria bacterium]|nr:cytidine deaminase [Gammaproteobacteria bacterium]
MAACKSQHLELIEEACAIIARRFKQDKYHLGAALRTRSGRLFTGVHLEAHVGRIAVCAEAIAIGVAATAGDTEIEAIVAVDRKGRVVSPCGMCRELISDHSPDCEVIIPGDNGPEVACIGDLLPRKYRKHTHSAPADPPAR